MQAKILSAQAYEEYESKFLHGWGDVSALSFGIETEGGIVTTVISRNTTVPTRKTVLMSTCVDNAMETIGITLLTKIFIPEAKSSLF